MRSLLVRNFTSLFIFGFLFFGIFLSPAKIFGIPVYGLFATICLIFSSTIFTGFTKKQLHYTFAIIILTAILVILSLYHDHPQLQSIFGCSAIMILGFFFKCDSKTLGLALSLFKFSLIFISILAFMQFRSIDARLVPITVYSLFQIPITEEMLVDIYNYPTGITGVAHIFYYGLAISLLILIYDYLYLIKNKASLHIQGFACCLFLQQLSFAVKDLAF